MRRSSSILKSLMILMRKERDFSLVRHLRKSVVSMKLFALVTGDVEIRKFCTSRWEVVGSSASFFIMRIKCKARCERD